METAEIAGIVAALRACGSPERAVQEKRYLKSDFTHLGAPVPAVRKVAVAAVRQGVTRDDVLRLARTLWAVRADGRPVHEARLAAVETLARRVDLLQAGDLAAGEELIRDSVTWALVDPLAEKVVGALAGRSPELFAELDGWPCDPYLWIRRSALLALLPGVRNGAPDLDRIGRYGDALLDEKEFFIRKAIGWVLRELAKKDPGWVRDWTAARVARISGVTLREAVRPLPAEERDALLAAYRPTRSAGAPSR